MLKVTNDVKLGIPPAFNERCAVRCTEYKFGPNKNQAPMITTSWELIGYFDQTGQLQTQMKRGSTSYQLAGLKLKQVYFTLTEKAIAFYSKFFEAANGEPLTEIDETNPNVEYLEGLKVQAIVSGRMEVLRKQLTDEEKAELKAEGKEQIGEPILDDEGKPLENANLQVGRWLKKFTGEIPE